MTEEIKPRKTSNEDLAFLSAQAKKHLEDNPLLEALTLVIESNAEYARGVSAILDSDLEREVALTEIRHEIAFIHELLDSNIELPNKNTEQLTELKTKLSSFEDLLQNKLKPLYVAASLQETGAQYAPTDKLVVNIQKLLSSKIFAMLSGILVWIVVKFLLTTVKY